MGKGCTRGRKAMDAAAAGRRGTAAWVGTPGAGRSGTAAAAAGAGRGHSSGRMETERGTARPARQTTVAAAQAGTGTRKDTAAPEPAAAGTGIGTAGSAAAGGRRCCRSPSPPGAPGSLVALNTAPPSIDLSLSLSLSLPVV
jgi:hypothetical protein